MAMTHNELLEMVKFRLECAELKYLQEEAPAVRALLSVVELHKPKNYIIKDSEITESWCTADSESLTPYPCATIQAIEKELM